MIGEVVFFIGKQIAVMCVHSGLKRVYKNKKDILKFTVSVSKQVTSHIETNYINKKEIKQN